MSDKPRTIDLTGELDDDMSQEVYDWVDQVPLSKPKRNIARDFSDGVLFTEVVYHFYPRLVDLHNYKKTDNKSNKLQNWKMLNDKILKRMGFRLQESDMQLALNAERGMIEKMLYVLKTQVFPSYEDRKQGKRFLGSSSMESLNPSGSSSNNSSARLDEAANQVEEEPEVEWEAVDRTYEHRVSYADIARAEKGAALDLDQGPSAHDPPPLPPFGADPALPRRVRSLSRHNLPLDPDVVEEASRQLTDVDDPPRQIKLKWAQNSSNGNGTSQTHNQRASTNHIESAQSPPPSAGALKRPTVHVPKLSFEGIDPAVPTPAAAPVAASVAAPRPQPVESKAHPAPANTSSPPPKQTSLGVSHQSQPQASHKPPPKSQLQVVVEYGDSKHVDSREPSPLADNYASSPSLVEAAATQHKQKQPPHLTSASSTNLSRSATEHRPPKSPAAEWAEYICTILLLVLLSPFFCLYFGIRAVYLCGTRD